MVVRNERSACRFVITNNIHQNCSLILFSEEMPSREWQRARNRAARAAAAAARNVPAYDETDLVKLVIVWLIAKLFLSIF